MELHTVIEALRVKRSVFHSEADFQFALAWEIQLAYPSAEIRLEYPPACDPNKRVDILVWLGGKAYPIELKYKSKKMTALIGDELFCLKNHGAQDLNAYDLIKDICRIESFAKQLEGFSCGYVLWLTNDPYYWREPTSDTVGYAQFSVHHGATKQGLLCWNDSLSAGSIRGRETPLELAGSYPIAWNDYSDVGVSNGLFKYALLEIHTP